MPVLEFAPPPPSAALDSPLKATTPRSTNIAPSGFLNSPRAAPPAFPSAGNDAQRTMWQERLQPSALGDDVSMELALSQETARRLSLRGGGGDDPGVATPGSEPSPYANGTQKEAPNGVDAGDAGQANGNGGLDGSDADEEELAPLHVEVRLKPTSTMRYDVLRNLVGKHLDEEYETILTHSEVHDWRDIEVLAQHVDRVWIGECSLPTSAVPLDSVSLVIHLYQPPSSSRLTEFTTSNADEDGDSDVPAASVLELPSLSLEGIWDSLIYEDDVKEKLLNYVYSTMLFSDASVDFNIVTWNRVVLLHGPPGTGKTSLCRALAQKLAIRLSDRYQHGKLVEINSHSLFSKWFSESGKLVQRLFAQVTELVEEEGSFVVVLIDEVESLTAARAGAMSGKEPSDALRVVNALLTQLDKLKHRKNCLVMTTSNLSEAIDNAFIDRADIKQYIGLPPTAAVYWIMQSCLQEMMRAGLVPSVELLDHKTVEVYRSAGTSGGIAEDERRVRCSLMLYELAEQCQGLSGRTLRRLPVLAHARHIGSRLASIARPKLESWIVAMRKCVQEEGKEMDRVNGNV
ncbi:hypothetical protein JCM8202_005403 [Rhodotorula sphaerocarpa]